MLGSTAARGNAYNDYEFIESYSGKILVHIDAEKGGWVTSNVYKMLRLTGYGGQTEPDTALLIKGENTDKSANFSDTVIEKLCIEGLKQSEPIKIIGANHFVIQNVRNEGNYPILCYCQNVIEGKISTNYGSVTVRVDNSSKVSLIPDEDAVDYEPLSKSTISDGKHRLYNCVDVNLNSTVARSPITYTPVGIVTTKEILNKPLRIQCADRFTLDVVYYDSEWNVIKYDEKGRMRPTGNVFFKQGNVVKDAYMSSSTVRDLRFVCSPDNSKVAYVGLFLRSQGASASPTFRISPQIAAAVVPSVMKK